MACCHEAAPVGQADALRAAPSTRGLPHSLGPLTAMPTRTYSRSSAWRAMWPLLFDRERYLRIAAEHEVAVSLRSAGYRASYEKGEYPKPGWESAAVDRARSHMQGLFSGLRRSLALTLAFAAVGGLIAFAFGKVHPLLPFAVGKALSLVGALFAAWATVFELGGYVHSFDGEVLHELLHPALFKAMFLPGLAVAAVGQLW